MYTDPILRLNSYPLIVAVEVIDMIVTQMVEIINNLLLLEIKIRRDHQLTLIQIKIIVRIKDSIDMKVKRFSSCIKG